MSELLKVLRESAMGWDDVGGEGGRWTISSLLLSKDVLNQVINSFPTKEVVPSSGRTIYSYTDGDTSYRVWVL